MIIAYDKDTCDAYIVSIYVNITREYKWIDLVWKLFIYEYKVTTIVFEVIYFEAKVTVMHDYLSLESRTRVASAIIMFHITY
jgi:hypothetical protein